MDVTEIPFNRFIGISRTDPPDTAMLKLQRSENLSNHLNTVHASAQFALAEAASGECLLRRFKDIASSASLIPVVREVLVKYRKPATGTLRATATVSDGDAASAIEALAGKGRAVIPVQVNVSDEPGTTTMTATFSWFIQKAK
jgi:acyl-coenzyme A thioesterase PaaI-like protein